MDTQEAKCSCATREWVYAKWATLCTGKSVDDVLISPRIFSQISRESIPVVFKDGRRAKVRQRYLHVMSCPEAHNGVQVRSCAQCHRPFRAEKDYHRCESCGSLWLASEWFSSSLGWTYHEEAEGSMWVRSEQSALITEDILAGILDSQREGDVLRELTLRLKCWSLPKGFDAYSAYVYPTEVIVDARGGQWGTLASTISNPLNGYKDERNLVRRSRRTAPWQLISRPVISSVSIGELTLSSTWGNGSSFRTLVVTDSASRRVVDKDIDREVTKRMKLFAKRRTTA